MQEAGKGSISPNLQPRLKDGSDVVDGFILDELYNQCLSENASKIVLLKEFSKTNNSFSQKIQQNFGDNIWSKDNLAALQQDYTPHLCCLKEESLLKKDTEGKAAKIFKKLRNAHSAVESSINMLKHYGLNRCSTVIKRFQKKCRLSIIYSGISSTTANVFYILLRFTFLLQLFFCDALTCSKYS